MKGLYISCSFNENFQEWKLFMKLNLSKGAGGNFTPFSFQGLEQGNFFII